MRHIIAPVLFLHIPKTSGTTLQYIIQEQYGLKLMNIHTNNVYKDLSVFEKMSPAEKKKLKVIKGHVNYQKYLADFPGNVTCFTLLREPVKRCISTFNYIYQSKNHPLHAKTIKEQYTLKDMLKMGYMKLFDNCQVRFLADHSGDYGTVNDEVYQLALKNFDTYFEIFGLCERFDESLIHFKRKLNWGNPCYIWSNATNKKNAVLNFDEETYALLNHYNKYDLMLYEYASKKFDAIIKSYGDGFAEEVKRFQKINKRQAPFRRLIRRAIQALRKPGHIPLKVKS